MSAAGVIMLAVVPGANMRYLAGLNPLSERIAVAFFPADGTPAMVLPALKTPRAPRQAPFQSPSTPGMMRWPTGALNCGLI
jgi:hypothetical protein